jgi:hypothetical protein
MSRNIEGFGGDGAHAVRFGAPQGEHIVWVKRDLWFDRNDGESWVVWAQHHAWDRDDPPAEDDDEATTLGSIVVTHPAVMAFLGQLGELLADPARFQHDPEFAEDPARADTTG